MDTQDSISRKLPAIISLARLAPSVHNTQPWRVSCDGCDIKIRLDASHVLSDGDPTGRQTTISLGIFCEAIKISAESLGFRINNVSLLGDEAVVTVGRKGAPRSQAQRYAQLLLVRHTDRSIYRPAKLRQNATKKITDTASKGVNVCVSTDRELINKVAELTGKGIGLAMSNPYFRKELARYLVLPGSNKQRGIAVKSLYIPLWLAVVQPWLVRAGLSTRAEVRLERKRWRSASAIIFITGDGDLADYWFEAGRTYMRVSLETAGLGLAQATSAAIVEASNYHDDIEKLLGTKQRILAMIRVGQGSPKHYYSPRVSIDELIT